ncbi:MULTISPECIES: helix-turn-helix domain-containing protein [unclassified Brevundimonas]
MSIHSTNDRVEASALAANDDAPKLNKRQASKVATREKLLHTARVLWAPTGSYEPVTIRDIAAAAGMSTGAIFANWQGKEELWREAMGYEPPVDCEAVRAALKAQAAQARWAA